MFLLLNTTGYGQKNTLKQSIYFESAKFDLTADSKATLNQQCDSLKSYATYKIFIKGNTDNIGDSSYNKQLSEQRVLAAQQYLIAQGINAKVFTTNAFGEDKPIADNTTDAGKQKNRRVDIAIAFTRNSTIAKPIAKELPSIDELYNQLSCRAQVFKINTKRDTALRCEGGTIVYVKANSFRTSSSTIRFSVKEAFLKSDMLLDNLSTTSDNKIIETRGMIYTEANELSGKSINSINNKKNIIAMIPTNLVKRNEQIFQGKRTGHDNILNWTVNNNSVLANFSLQELNICASFLCGGGGSQCPLFFCEIRYFINDLLFRSRSQSNGQLSREMRNKCSALDKLYKDYGVNNLTALIDAVNKPLLDRYNVKTYAELQDTIKKINTQKVELAYLNKSLSYDDYRYYVFNITNMGWANIDVFQKFMNDQLTTLKVDLKAESNTDCKLVFKNRRIILPASREGNQYVFKNVPRGDTAWVVAIKYEEGKPFVYIQSTSISNKTLPVEFRSLTLAELKEELKLLNQ
ncbi:MAG: OmpA family protein [Bacteroidota bacterium]